MVSSSLSPSKALAGIDVRLLNDRSLHMTSINCMPSATSLDKYNVFELIVMCEVMSQTNISTAVAGKLHGTSVSPRPEQSTTSATHEQTMHASGHGAAKAPTKCSELK